MMKNAYIAWKRLPIFRRIMASKNDMSTMVSKVLVLRTITITTVKRGGGGDYGRKQCLELNNYFTGGYFGIDQFC